MALQFNPPEWLVQEYYKQRNTNDIANAITGAANTYLQFDEARRRNKALDAEALNRQRDLEMKGREQFYNYGDIQGLPANVRASIGQPIQGPNAQVPFESVPYGVARNAQLGGAEGPAQNAPLEQTPATSPLIDHYNKFLEQNPFGLKGQQMTEDTVLLKDEKGNIVGTSKVQRPIKGKTLMTGPGGVGQNYNFTRPQQSPYVSQKGVPLEYTPSVGYTLARMAPGIVATQKKGDESAITDANLIAVQLPQVDKLFNAYKDKSSLAARTQATPLGYLQDPAVKQIENSLKLTAFTFGGKNLTGQEKEVVFGAFFPKWTDNPESLENKRQILKQIFTGKIDLLEAANLLGPSGKDVRKMLEQKAQTPAQSGIDAPTAEDGYVYTPGPGGKANPSNWRPQ